jgi:hypothetical protein
MSFISFIQSYFVQKEDLIVPHTYNELSLKILDYMASLASNPKNIRLQIEKAKQIAPMENSPDKIKFLINIYLEIEEYLVKKDPVRRLTQQQLREKIRDRFKIETADDQFQSLFLPKQ